MENLGNLQDWLIHRFIARPDCLAIQARDGKWSPARQNIPGTPYEQLPLIAWNRDILEDHIDGTLTAGHYMLSKDSTVKLIVFDIDFADQGFCPANYSDDGAPQNYEVIALRDEWHNRGSLHRSWLKSRLRMLSGQITSAVFAELEVPVAVAYSGNKGVHVYAFTGELPAAEARLAAEMVMKCLNGREASPNTNFQLSRGSFEWTDTSDDLDFSYKNLTVEVFPKQDEIGAESFGNLVAMPLGVNQKHRDDPKFFIDLRAPINELTPCDPLWALSTDNPWKD